MLNKKYWLYYLKKNNDISLYAYTDNPKFSKKFEKERDMNKFIKYKYIFNKDEIHEITLNYTLNFLKEYKLNMYDKESKQWYQNNIIMTIDETLTMNRSITTANSQLFLSCWYDPYIFNDNIVESLKTLGYFKIFNNVTDRNKDLTDYIDEHNEIDEPISMKVDELGIFLKHFGYTMKGM